MDLISRHEAIVMLRANMSEPNEAGNFFNYGLELAITLLSQLSSAQPEQQWTPCSEGLPKKDGRYYVTRHDYVTQTNFADILWYEKGMWWNRQSTGDYAVIAWMPLIEPYRAEE